MDQAKQQRSGECDKGHCKRHHEGYGRASARFAAIRDNYKVMLFWVCSSSAEDLQFLQMFLVHELLIHGFKKSNTADKERVLNPTWTLEKLPYKVP